MLGHTISHYRIVEKIGEGGMGVVYKATDTRLDRPVAIKLLTSARLAPRELKQRFTQEAKAASALNHPNIITIYDIEAAGDEPFMAMEFVRGRTLHQCIDRRGLPLSDAIKYLTQVAEALSTAHAAGIVHRDLKPANIMVGDNGVVKAAGRRRQSTGLERRRKRALLPVRRADDGRFGRDRAAVRNRLVEGAFRRAIRNHSGQEP
jgi:eukaryotic-like serine/threonine-protein kinase